jgi:thiosulfate reductase/polysulfide reductase chain A
MSLSRRDFLKYSSMVAAGTAVPLSEAELFSHLFAMDGMPEEKVRYIPTYCEICFWNCGAVAAVVNGKVQKLEGNPYDPRSRGKLCARGNAGIGQLYDQDRLKHPMIRTGKRGDGNYRPASWEESLDYIAGKMTKIKDEYGPESVAFMMHGGITSHLLKLGKAFGSPNFGFPSYGQCRVARDVGYGLTYGGDVGSPERLDMPKSKMIVMFGTHLGENMHNSQVQDFTEALGNRAKIIVVDPRFSTAAGKADHWLPIKPGTDIALMLAWINIIISEGLYDREYVSRYTVGFDELKKSVREYTPEWSSKETDLPAGLIVKLAREMGRNAPSVCIHPGRFTAWHGNDTQRERCLAILGAILGTWGREGGIYLPTKASPSMKKKEGKRFPTPKRPSIARGPHPFAKPQLMQAVRRATITAAPYPIKGWVVAGTNILRAVPAPMKSIEAIMKLDLLVAIDIKPLDTAMMADVVLPECTYLERHDKLKIYRGRSLSVGIRQPIVKPMYESKEGWWIIKELSKRLGLEEYFPYETYEDNILEECSAMGINYEELKKVGTRFYTGTDAPYITSKNQPTFRTPSGKIELYSKQLKEKGFDPIPKYRRIEQPDSGWFRLLSGRSAVHSFSRTTNNQRLFELFKENVLWLNADSASGMGIKDGEGIIIINQDNVRSEKIRAKVTQRIRNDCVYMVHGFGAKSKRLSRAYERGADDNRLMTRFIADPISGSTGMRVNFVKIEKA